MPGPRHRLAQARGDVAGAHRTSTSERRSNTRPRPSCPAPAAQTRRRWHVGVGRTVGKRACVPLERPCCAPICGSRIQQWHRTITRVVSRPRFGFIAAEDRGYFVHRDGLDASLPSTPHRRRKGHLVGESTPRVLGTKVRAACPQTARLGLPRLGLGTGGSPLRDRDAPDSTVLECSRGTATDYAEASNVYRDVLGLPDARPLLAGWPGRDPGGGSRNP